MLSAFNFSATLSNPYSSGMFLHKQQGINISLVEYFALITRMHTRHKTHNTHNTDRHTYTTYAAMTSLQHSIITNAATEQVNWQYLGLVPLSWSYRPYSAD